MSNNLFLLEHEKADEVHFVHFSDFKVSHLLLFEEILHTVRTTEDIETHILVP